MKYMLVNPLSNINTCILILAELKNMRTLGFYLKNNETTMGICKYFWGPVLVS